MFCLIIFKIMEDKMKKLLIFIAMLAVATTLFAENNTISCESDLGKCTYTLTDSFSRECTCRDNTGVSEAEIPPEGGTVEATLPTEEECLAELADICGNADILCENEAGECSMEPNGEYNCGCYGIVNGYHSGTADSASEESCSAVLVEHCGTAAATARTLCTDSEIFSVCLTYAKSFTNTCYEPLTDEEMEAALDLPAATNDTTAALAVCCQDEESREGWFKDSFECLEAVESCDNKECCETCDVFVLEESNEKEDGDEVIAPAPEDGAEDAGNTETPTEDAVDNGDGSAAPTDGADAPAEKEESKSDGCSMLFI